MGYLLVSRVKSTTFSLLQSFLLVTLSCGISATLLYFYLYQPGDFTFISAPTTFDGNSYSNEILAYSDAIQEFNLEGILQSYGALVTFLYSPSVLFDNPIWCAVVNIIAMTVSVRLLSIIADSIFAAYACREQACTVFTRWHHRLVFRSGLLLLTAFNPYYIASYLVPSKDILSLLIVTFLGHLILNGGIYNIFLLIPILISSFFTRISTFAIVLFSVVQARIAVIDRFKHVYNSMIPAAVYSFSFFLISLVNLGRINEFDTAGSFITDFTNSGLKPVLFLLMPSLYSLWDLSKTFLDGDSKLNIVVFSFAVNGIYLFLLIPLFFVLFVFKKNNYWPSREIKSLVCALFVAFAAVFSNSFIHPRYIYEFVPLVFILVLVDSCFNPNNRLVTYFTLCFAVSIAFILKIILFLFNAASSNYPDYVLPPFLNLI